MLWGFGGLIIIAQAVVSYMLCAAVLPASSMMSWGMKSLLSLYVLKEHGSCLSLCMSTGAGCTLGSAEQRLIENMSVKSNSLLRSCLLCSHQHTRPSAGKNMHVIARIARQAYIQLMKQKQDYNNLQFTVRFNSLAWFINTLLRTNILICVILTFCIY